MDYVISGLQLLVGLLLLVAGAAKLYGSEYYRYYLKDIGIWQGFRIPLGLLEIVGACLLLAGLGSRILTAAGAVILLVALLFALVTKGFVAKRGWVTPLIFVALCGSLLALRQPTIDDIVKLTMNVEMGEVQTVPAKTLVSFPDDVPALFESIVAAPEGHFFVTIGNKGIIRRVERDGSWKDLTQLPSGEYGVRRFEGVVGTLVLDPQGWLYATLVAMDPANRGVWRISSKDGTAALFAKLPADSQPNGITIDSAGDFYVADSNLATIWKISGQTGEVINWHQDDLFSRRIKDAAPGANGVKIWEDGLYVTNSFTGNVIRVQINTDGSAGAASIVAQGLPSDDLAFDVNGAMYITTHIFNTIVRVDPDGTKTVIATAAEEVVGPTDVAFGVTAEDMNTLYVINDGGFVLPFEGAVPNIVALNVDVEGVPIPFSF